MYDLEVEVKKQYLYLYDLKAKVLMKKQYLNNLKVEVIVKKKQYMYLYDLKIKVLVKKLVKVVGYVVRNHHPMILSLVNLLLEAIVVLADDSVAQTNL